MRKKLFILTSIIFTLLFIGSAPVFSREKSILPGPKPAPASAEQSGLTGKYGEGKDNFLVLEKHGKLFIWSEKNKSYYLLKKISADKYELTEGSPFVGEIVQFKKNNRGKGTECRVGERSFKRIPYDGEDGKTFKIKLLKPVKELRPAAMKAYPPRNKGFFNKPDLVEPVKMDPSIKLDIRYATDNNFMGEAFYESSRAFLQRPAAEALVRVSRKLKKLGYGLVIYDAYRPWYVTKMFWDATPDKQKNFVANPSSGSRHNRGCAVDVTLYDLKTGKQVDMVSGFDEFSERAYPGYPGRTSLRRWNRALLNNAMASEGFTVNPCEWWHFDYRDWEKYHVLNKSFEELGK